ncbi:hypothetical protein AB0H28_01955 [Micromonospora sp. NPDC050980]|uniref:hypothetical protein n=1 Tax=Micromonospora sp. NPDC050980 TaxID=3155161 RepID=UPI0033F0BAA4
MTAAPESFRSPEGGWTTDDLDQLPDDGRRRFEILDGNLVMSPLLPEPWEIDIPLARITPRGR